MSLATKGELVLQYFTVCDAFERRPSESLSGAAFRVFRQNCARPEVLRAAKIVLGMTGKPAREQWTALAECAELVSTRRGTRN